MERSSLHDRRERLTKLIPKIGPLSFARDRVLAVPPALESLLPEAGLIRGSVIGCQGATAVSVALALVSAASAAGSWLAVAGVPTLGLGAASEVGIALDRLVMVADAGRNMTRGGEAGRGEEPWANVLSALIDGFDLIVLRADVRATVARRLQARLQARGAVLVLIGDPGPFSCDITITSGLGTSGLGTSGLGTSGLGTGGWEGLDHGSGRLVRRRLTLSASGRRLPRQRHADVWLPGATGGIEPAAPIADQIHDSPAALGPTGLRCRAEWRAEMAG